MRADELLECASVARLCEQDEVSLFAWTALHCLELHRRQLESSSAGAS
jgi:hypothetical protein